MTSTYEMIERNDARTESASVSVRVDLEVLNNKIRRTLLDLGLTEDEASVLLLLNKKGEMKASEVAYRVEVPRTRLYFVLESLQNKGLVFSTIERPTKFRALTLEKAVDCLIESYRHKLDSLEEAREVISYDWSLLQENEVVRSSAPELGEQSLQVISGEDQIYSKAKNILMQGAREVKVFANARNLAKLSHSDITNKLQLLASNGTVVEVLTNIPSCEISLLEQLNRCKIRDIPSHFNNNVLFIIVDNREILLFNLDKQGGPSVVWSDSASFIVAMSLLFQTGWSYVGV